MSDLVQAIQMLNYSVTVSRKKYVYFDKNDGSVVEITNSFEEKEDVDYIMVDLDQVIEILNGKKSTNNFKVEYDFINKEYQLVEISSLAKPGLILYEIPTYMNNEEKELSIVYSKKNKTLYFTLDEKAKHNLKSIAVYIDKAIPFYISERGNPDVLYKTLDIKVKDLLWNEIFEEYIGDLPTDISILTYNYFSGYILEVINE